LGWDPLSWSVTRWADGTANIFIDISIKDLRFAVVNANLTAADIGLSRPSSAAGQVHWRIEITLNWPHAIRTPSSKDADDPKRTWGVRTY
jgi:hypothetical protein